MKFQLEPAFIERFVRSALEEDVGSGDVTSQAIIPPDQQEPLHIVARDALHVSGMAVAEAVFEQVDSTLEFTARVSDGEALTAGAVMAQVKGSVRSILIAERVALNILQRMCGVATLTARYVEQVRGTKAQILDTRKTIPLWRILDKYAVQCGGGTNHRIGLYDAMMIKDNHIAAAGNITKAFSLAKRVAPAGMMIEVECDTLEQLKEALSCGVEWLLLDNMSVDVLKTAVELVDNKAKTEASGNVSLDNVRAIAETGVDRISIGKITHSAPAVDIGLDAIE